MRRLDRGGSTADGASDGPVAASAAVTFTGAALGGALALVNEALAAHLYRDPIVAQWIRWLALLVPLLAGSEMFGNICRGFGFATPYVLIRNVIPQLIFMFLLGVLLVNEQRPPISESRTLRFALALLCAYGAAASAGLVAVFSVSRRELVGVRGLSENATVLRYGVPVLAGTVVYLLIGWTDLLMLGATHPSEEAGRYRACMQLVFVLEMLAIRQRSTAVGASGPLGSPAPPDCLGLQLVAYTNHRR